MPKNDTIHWGIMSTAKIAREKVIPAIQKSSYSQVLAIGSPNQAKAEEIAERLSIPVVKDSYEALLSDAEIDAVYIPLPNHLHVQWAIKALEAGKHVLCEKPIGMNAAEADKLAKTAAQFPQLKVMEAFMYRFHPQWKKAKQLVDDGMIGQLRMVQSFFSYFNIDPANIRNRQDAGGGGMMDIGCYCVSFARFLFGKEPKQVIALTDYDETMGTDRMLSGILDFSSGQSVFTCSTQLMPYQRVNIIGTKGRIEVLIPVNAPPDQAARIILYSQQGEEVFQFDPVDQYTCQAEAFCRAILEDIAVPVSLDDSARNMRVIEAVLESGRSEKWVAV